MNIREKIHWVINEAYPSLELLQDDYFIIGSAALILTGIEITDTRDIDILTSDRDANRLRGMWKSRLVENHTTTNDDLFRSNFSRYHFGALDVEILGDLEVQKDNQWKRLIIQDYIIHSEKGIQLKLPSIEEQKRIFQWFGRDKDIIKLDLIERHKSDCIL